MKTVLFIVQACCIHVVLLWLTYNRLERSDLNFLVDRGYVQDSPSIEILVMGDSHPGCDIIPVKLGAAYSLCAPAQNYEKTYYRLRYILTKMKSPPGLVILPYDFHSFTNAYVGQSETWYWGSRMNYLKIGWERNAVGEGIKKYLRYRVIPYAGALEFFSKQKENCDRHQIRCGYVPNPLAFTSVVSWSREKLMYAAKMRADLLVGTGRRLNLRIKAYFEKAVNLCLDNGIEVVLVRFPIMRCLHKEILRHVQEEDLNTLVTSCVDFDNRIQLLDYTFLYSDSPEFFGDLDHLNKEGALQFTERLKQDLAKIKSSNFDKHK